MAGRTGKPQKQEKIVPAVAEEQENSIPETLQEGEAPAVAEEQENSTPETLQEDEAAARVCIAQAYILYNSTQYKPGDKVPTNNPEMLEAWLKAGTVAWVAEPTAG